VSPPVPAPFRWQPLFAFVLPFFLFVMLTSLEAMETLKPWYPILYLIKIVLVAGSLWWGRKHYPKWNWEGVGIGLIVGLLGGVVWIVLCTWSLEQYVLPGIASTLADWLQMPSLTEWIKPGSRVGFNPFETLSTTTAWGFVVARLIGMVILVPLLEEFFWRGFLNRIVQEEEWEQVPWGKYTRFSFAIVTLAFVAVHTEWTAALVWIIGINLLYWKTKNLWACVIAHAASNAVLAYYILAHQQWHLW
jgi:CAAX prenyl protease-like protein